MNDKLDLLLIDNSNKIIEQINIEKPPSYQNLISIIKNRFKELPRQFIIFYKSGNNEIQIRNEKEYEESKSILFIRKINNLEESIFALNYNKLSDSVKEILDEKYTCLSCTESIKDENPYICYNCQKRFHIKCLEDWETKRKLQNEELNCPNCRKELPLKNWKKQLDYIENRKNEAVFLKKLNDIELKNNLNENINKINEQKLLQLKTE